MIRELLDPNCAQSRTSNMIYGAGQALRQQLIAAAALPLGSVALASIAEVHLSSIVGRGSLYLTDALVSISYDQPSHKQA